MCYFLVVSSIITGKFVSPNGFAVDNATLNRFFTFNFLIPFVIVATVIIHFLFLYKTGSNRIRIPLHTDFSIKDIVEFITLTITGTIK